MRFLLALTAIASGQTLSAPDAIRIAFSHRASIQAAEHRVKAAEHTRSVLGASLPTRLEFGKGTEPDVTGGEDLLLAQPLDLFGRAALGRATGDAGLRAAKASLRQAQLDLEVDVIEAYADVQSANELVSTGRSLNEIASKVYEATKRQIDLGDLQPAQLLRIDLERERASQTLAVRERSLTTARLRLAAVLGIPVNELREIDPEPLSLPASLAGPEARPDLQQLRAEVATSRADVRTTRLDGWPEIELQFRRSPFSSPEQYGARIQFVWPFWDHGAARSKNQAAQQTLRSSEAALADRLALSKSEIEAAQVDRDAARDAVASFARLVNDATVLLQKEQRGFDLGASTLLDVLNATRAVREIQESLVEARRKLATAESTYLRATGTIVGETK